jgi:hypothetical protein
MAWSVEHGYLAIALCMVGMTIGLRIIMTICAVALIDAMPEQQTSIGAALNDTAQELGTSVGIATVGTVLAAVIGSQLPTGTWTTAMVSPFFTGERTAYLVLALLVGAIATWRQHPTNSRSTEKPTDSSRRMVRAIWR